MNEMTQMVSDLHRLRSASINVVLYKLTDTQTDISLLKEGIVQEEYPLQMRDLTAQVEVLRDVIRQMWEVNFGEGAAR